jgi:hypothetical protein
MSVERQFAVFLVCLPGRLLSLRGGQPGSGCRFALPEKGRGLIWA